MLLLYRPNIILLLYKPNIILLLYRPNIIPAKNSDIYLIAKSVCRLEINCLTD